MQIMLFYLNNYEGELRSQYLNGIPPVHDTFATCNVILPNRYMLKSKCNRPVNNASEHVRHIEFLFPTVRLLFTLFLKVSQSVGIDSTRLRLQSTTDQRYIMAL